jgi:hypothetical protein
MVIWTQLAENEKLQPPAEIPPENREAWLDFAKRLVDLHRHEDGLLNTRLQGFIVATALLIAALSQFREERFLPIATLICLAGLVLADLAFRVLRRTARTVEWYIDVLVRLDPLLYGNERHRLHESRRQLLRELDTGERPPLYPASALLGAWLPFLVPLIWFVMLVALGWIHLALVF